MEAPYKGLAPYDAMDRDKFFGREREARIVTDKIYACPVTLLFARTGVGKSSLVRAAVMPTLIDKYHLDVVYHASWAQDPLQDLKAAVKQTLINNDKISGQELKETDSFPAF